MILALLSLFCLLYSIKRNGTRSLMTLGIACTSIYALPAMFNLTAPQQYIPTGESRYFIEPLPLTVYMYCLYFVFLILNLKLLGPNRTFDYSQRSRMGMVISLYISLLAWVGINVVNDGITFFLQPRFSLTGSVLEMILKWSIPLAIFYGVITKNKIRFVGFIFLFLQFMTGDRTVLAITLVGFVYLSITQSYSLKIYFKPRFFLLGFGAFFLVVFGKPIYRVVKSGSFEYFLKFLTYDSVIMVLTAFEPISIFNHFDFTVRDNIWMSPFDFFWSVFGNFIVAPSAIGINVNQTNLYLMDAYPKIITNGIGGSYLANAWMMGRVLGLYIFSLIFLGVLHFSDVYAQRKQSFLASIFVLLGALMAVYSHRNGLGNILAFYRQIGLVCCVIMGVKIAVQLLKVRKND